MVGPSFVEVERRSMLINVKTIISNGLDFISGTPS